MSAQDEHHDRLHGLCAHGEMRGDCDAFALRQYPQVRPVLDERARQEARWGQQNHPDGTGGNVLTAQSNRRRAACEQAFAEGRGTWKHILDEEVAEAFAETDPDALVAELTQVAAVCIAWVAAIERRA